RPKWCAWDNAPPPPRTRSRSSVRRHVSRGTTARYTRAVSLLAAVVALAELCAAAPEPAAARDPADSTAYTAVGDDAAASGDATTAAIAYRKALVLDPANDRARAALAALCKDATVPSDVPDGTGGPARSDAANLLDAITRYRAGDRAAAGAAL